VPGTSEIDRLIEDGLDRYGSGDLDGALLAWEKALAIDPDNKQATSYVDYVRQHYEMLLDAEISVDGGEDTPFAIHEEPEYQIEVKEGELARSSRPSIPPVIDEVDSGWDMEETQDTSSAANAPPPPPPAPPVRDSNASGGLTFDEATREYSAYGARGATIRDAAAEAASEFEAEGTPVGFTNQLTDVKKRDFGFVQPREETAEATAHTDAKFRPPKKTIAPVDPDPDPAGEIELGASDSGRVATKDLPVQTRAPATGQAGAGRSIASAGGAGAPRDPTALSQAEVMLPHAATKELDRSTLFSSFTLDDPQVGQPTRDLGLRPNPIKIPETDDDIPTRESDARAIREQAAAAAHAAQRRLPSRPMTESTRHDISSPFDPVDAQAAQILDEIDAGAPAGESPDDRSRRRIGALFERAIAFNNAGDSEKALIATDLALDEDPTSALAQKLIHRNRDAAMQVFQNYLGDLERQPALAKPLHELSSAPISPRAAFLLSRIDGTLTVDEILDVSGMPRLEAYRYLCQLFLRGILK
jgi:tetratricopeptide (TPR) repeat protein